MRTRLIRMRLRSTDASTARSRLLPMSMAMASRPGIGPSRQIHPHGAFQRPIRFRDAGRGDDGGTLTAPAAPGSAPFGLTGSTGGGCPLTGEKPFMSSSNDVSSVSSGSAAATGPSLSGDRRTSRPRSWARRSTSSGSSSISLRRLRASTARRLCASSSDLPKRRFATVRGRGERAAARLPPAPVRCGERCLPLGGENR